MNVKLATQTLSNSTKDALLYLKESKKYRKEFLDVDGTATFCKKINDVLNCRTRFNKRFESHKIPLYAATKDQLKEKADDIIKYICRLKMQNNTTLMTKCSRKCGFVGLIVCLKNIFCLYDDLQKYDLKYLLTYKLLQDHIENFFCAVRVKGGFNNNPDVFQFRCAYRRLLMHHDVTSSNNANCQPDKIPILIVTYKKKDVTKVLDEDILQNDHMFDFENIDEVPSEVLHDVVCYIGGYIVMKLKNKKTVAICPLCLDMLENKTSSSPSIKVKNRGGLKEPTEDVVKICLTIETVIQRNNDRIFLPGFLESTVAQICDNHSLVGKIHHEHDRRLTELITQYYIKLRLPSRSKTRL